MAEQATNRCPKLGKIMYPSWKAATFRLIKIQQDTAAALYTVHKCQHCHQYHLTTSNKKAEYRLKVPNGNARRSKANRR